MADDAAAPILDRILPLLYCCSFEERKSTPAVQRPLSAMRITGGRFPGPSQSWFRLPFLSVWFVLGWMKMVILLSVLVTVSAQNSSSSPPPPPPPNIHAVIVSSSRYWFNYRHAMNALGVYQILKQNGIPDSQIVLMIADEYATNPRNPFKNGMYANGVSPEKTWYSEDTELDYRGSDVTVQNFFNAVLGTGGPKSLQHTNEESHVMIFVTGHGGDQFFKFQDEEEMTAQDIANLMEELARRKKFRKALFIADTCQAFTLFDKVTTPNVYALGTSLRDENAYAHHSDRQLGLAVIERWSHGFIEQYKKREIHPASTTLYDLMVKPFEGKILGADIGVLGDFRRLFFHDFFGKSSIIEQKIAAAKASSSDTPSSEQIPVVVAVHPSPQSTTVSPKRASREELSQSTTPTRTSSRTKTGDVAPPEGKGQAGLQPGAPPSLEPTDYSFGILVGGLIVLVVSASQFGKSNDDDDDAII